MSNKQDLIFKMTRTKMVGGKDQALEYLPSKHSKLSSNSSTSKIKATHLKPYSNYSFTHSNFLAYSTEL
jgi:hypothetical protein